MDNKKREPTCFCGEVVVRGKPCRCQREDPPTRPTKDSVAGPLLVDMPYPSGRDDDVYDHDPGLEDYEYACVGWSSDTERY